MRATWAQLPAARESADRVLVTADAVVVLDGASAFAPVPVSATRYVDALGGRLIDLLGTAQDVDLRELLGVAIREVAAQLELSTGPAPSSTVSIVRDRGDAVEVLVLGDSLVALGAPRGVRLFGDPRLAELDLPERATYHTRLASGSGFDTAHSTILAALQRQQARRRNVPDGYWIAEANPVAAAHAVHRSVPKGEVAWAVLATDGAANPMAFLGLDDWPALTRLDSGQLDALLRDCHAWEADADPDGRRYPRAKRHDDKTLAVVTFGSPSRSCGASRRR